MMWLKSQIFSSRCRVHRGDDLNEIWNKFRRKVRCPVRRHVWAVMIHIIIARRMKKDSMIYIYTYVLVYTCLAESETILIAIWFLRVCDEERNIRKRILIGVRFTQMIVKCLKLRTFGTYIHIYNYIGW